MANAQTADMKSAKAQAAIDSALRTLSGMLAAKEDFDTTE